MESLPTDVCSLFLQGQMFVVHRIQHGVQVHLIDIYSHDNIIWNGFSTSVTVNNYVYCCRDTPERLVASYCTRLSMTVRDADSGGSGDCKIK